METALRGMAHALGDGRIHDDTTFHVLQADVAMAELKNMFKADILATNRDLNVAWLVLCGALVFFMQAGFAMLEVGIVQPKNATNILFKNLIDASLAAITWWLVGFGVAFGTDNGNNFIGTDNYAINMIKRAIDCDAVANGGPGGSCGRTETTYWSEAGAVVRSYQFWFFQWAFAGAAATIVAGSVCERAKIEAYFIYSIVLSIFIYPVVVHWGWADGFLSPWTAKRGPIFSLDPTKSNGMIDFAGSGVVHMVGGFSGLMGAIITGPRRGRFVDGQVVDLYQGNKILQCLGAFILWFGWYGFNCGSTISVSHGMSIVAGKVAMNTTIAAGAGAIIATFGAKIIMGHYDISMGLNGLLAGLVSITANCAVVEPWHAVIIGGVGAMWLYIGHYALLRVKIDDPVDAAVVHGLCGYWGLLCSGIFCVDKNIQFAAYPGVNDACARGEQFGVQVVGGLCIIAWTVGTAGATFLAINATIGMRVSAEMEDEGLDASEHGHVLDDPYTKGRDAVPPALAMAPQTQTVLVPMSVVQQPMMGGTTSSYPGFENFAPYGNQFGNQGYPNAGGF